jgi:hypothetical protein
MSRPVTSQTSAGAPGIPEDSVSEPHANAHLVSTGWNFEDIAEYRLYIDIAVVRPRQNCCKVFWFNKREQNIAIALGFSPRVTIKEHGWFTDVAMFEQIAKNHPIPDGQSPEDIFIKWQDSLLVFLDTHHGDVGAQWKPIT